jgi:hypothetical protein
MIQISNTQFFKKMADRWPSVLVSRDSVEDFTGGLVNRRTLANLDSQGVGPAGRIRCGRKVAYQVSHFVEWLEKRCKFEN